MAWNPDYRSRAQRDRDRRREREEQTARDAEKRAAIRAEIDRRIEIAELFPDIKDRDLATTGAIAFAYRLADLEVMELAWMRIWQRTWDIYAHAVENGDRAGEMAAKEELDQISHIAVRLGDTKAVRDNVREESSAAA